MTLKKTGKRDGQSFPKEHIPPPIRVPLASLYSTVTGDFFCESVFKEF